jgi:hypothetical protein
LQETVSEDFCEKSFTGSETFPLDWSLKTKVRFLSSTPFGWCTPLRGVDESKGVEDFVKNSPLHSPEELVVCVTDGNVAFVY